MERLVPFGVETENLLALSPALGDRNLSAAILQDHLRSAGYFHRATTGLFGAETQEALAAFIADFSLAEPSDVLTEKTAAYLLAARKRLGTELAIAGTVEQGASGQSTAYAQRILRFLGYYDGRTDGTYSLTLLDAILRFQQDKGLVGTAIDPGASVLIHAVHLRARGTMFWLPVERTNTLPCERWKNLWMNAARISTPFLLLGTVAPV
jgi:peptidoglycan hydrolase-like protein with peptidoglycan-binding domain